MGGAAGHMQHPFDLPQVETGKDLIDFFNAAAQEVQQNPAAVKIDGVNVSFKLVEGPQFAVDRGSLKPADIQGITLDRVGERGLKPGMENSVTMLLTILNEALPTLWPELKALGMDKDPSLFLNTEYVAETTNVTSYEDKFIAIHGLNQFYEKTPLRGGGPTRPGAEKPADIHRSVASYEIRSSANDPAMIKLVEKLKPFAEKYNFKVYGTVPSYTVTAPDFNNTLNSEFTVNLGRDESGEVVSRTQTLGQWLAEAVNPRDNKITLADGTKPGAIEKKIYGAILEGAILSEFLAEGPEWWAGMQSGEGVSEGGDIKLAVDAAVIYHATRLLGNDIFAVLKTDAMGVDGQSVTEHEGVVLRNPKLFGPKPVKITGEFLWKGWKETGFGVQSESLTRLNEQVDVQGCQRAIAVVPGAFKPPHKGHLAMINTYAQQLGPNGMVYIYISPIPASKRKGFNPETQAEVTPQQSFDLWEVYTKNLPNVKTVITPSQYKTPVQAAYEFVGPQGPVQAGDCVFMGSSTKGGDDKRFRAGLQKHAVEGVEVRSLPVEPLGDLSATQFREAIKAGDIETISNVFLPTEVLTPQEEVMIYNTLGIETEPNQALQELLVQLIDEADGDFQQKMKKRLKTAHQRLLDKGPQDPGSAFPTKRKGGKSNAFLAKEQKGEQPAIGDEDFRAEDWGQYRTGGWIGDIPDVDTSPWPKDLNQAIELTRRRMYDSYTSGPNRQAWEEKVGPETYERDILPQIQYVVKNVPIKYMGDEEIKRMDTEGIDGVQVAAYAAGDHIMLDPRSQKIQVSFEDGTPFERTSKPSSENTGVIAHEIAHVVDQHFKDKLSRDQAEKLKQLVDPEKFCTDNKCRVAFKKWAEQPGEIEAEVLSLRNRFGRQFTTDDVEEICRREGRYGHIGGYLNCDDVQRTTDILNSIVKVDEPQTQQKQMVAEEQMDEISSMAGGSVEGAAGAGGGPWTHMDVEEENEKEKRNAKIPHGSRLVEEDELVEEVLNYLLRKIGE